MAIRYRITKRSNTITNTNKEQYIMQAVNTGTISIRQISDEISRESTVSKVDITAVLVGLEEKLKQHLSDGKIVELGDVGKFKLGFKSTAESEPSLLSPKKNILKYHVNFQPSKYLKQWLKKEIRVYKEAT
jgi:predicted histone-like DNA-binding protein